MWGGTNCADCALSVHVCECTCVYVGACVCVCVHVWPLAADEGCCSECYHVCFYLGVKCGRHL